MIGEATFFLRRANKMMDESSESGRKGRMGREIEVPL